MPNRVILITGANGGLGQAIARSFLAESKDNYAFLGIHNRRDKVDALAVEFSDRCSALALDVTQSSAWQNALSQLLAKHRSVDVLVNNAGHHHDGLLAMRCRPKPLATRSSPPISTPVFHGCQSVHLPTMISQRSGRIVNIAYR